MDNLEGRSPLSDHFVRVRLSDILVHHAQITDYYADRFVLGNSSLSAVDYFRRWFVDVCYGDMEGMVDTDRRVSVVRAANIYPDVGVLLIVYLGSTNYQQLRNISLHNGKVLRSV